MRPHSCPIEAFALAQLGYQYPGHDLRASVPLREGQLALARDSDNISLQKVAGKGYFAPSGAQLAPNTLSTIQPVERASSKPFEITSCLIPEGKTRSAALLA